jgi:uncharacterized membrane-anchored protein
LSEARTLAAALCLALAATGARAQEAPVLPWEKGPIQGAIGGSLAEIQVPEGYVFLGKEGTASLLQLMENPVSGQELATLAPASRDDSWFLIFEWDPIGWVDDADKETLDAEGMLGSIREGTRAANEEREKRGWATIEIVGWQEAPHYDEQTHNLTWAITGRSEGHEVVNRMVKLLGS